MRHLGFLALAFTAFLVACGDDASSSPLDDPVFSSIEISSSDEATPESSSSSSIILSGDSHEESSPSSSSSSSSALSSSSAEPALSSAEGIEDLSSSSAKSPADIAFGTLTDERDGKTYKTVQIGKQTWMAENLNYETSGSRCYDKKNANCEKYGRLYTHAVAQNACPNGWKLPTGKQWAKLLNIDVSLFNLVGMFKHFSSDINTNDDPYGFNVLPGGIYDGGKYRGIGRTTAFWANEAKSVKTSDGLRVYMVYFVRFSPNQVTLAARDESDYFSVRCIKK